MTPGRSDNAAWQSARAVIPGNRYACETCEKQMTCVYGYDFERIYAAYAFGMVAVYHR